MKKIVLIGGVLVVGAAAVVFSLMRGPQTMETRNQAAGRTRGTAPVSPGQAIRPPGKAGPAAIPHRSGPPVRQDKVAAPGSIQGPGSGAGALREPAAGEKPAATIATVATDPGAVAATVNRSEERR